ncbi:MAG: NAD-dependent epimerase/dehydratase family protein [Planctomycetes bacterium]|nr:NAD-dependent epimerase/dehydratase family protein [Planctomycetota bacterium]
MEKTILITGGTGFIGSHLVARSLSKGYRVTVLDLQPHTFAFPIDNAEQVEMLAADIAVSESVHQALKGRSFHYVVNGAGYIDHTLFRDGGRRLIRQHFEGAMNLVEALDRDSLEGFVQIGSSDEYGDEPAPQTETMREAPISPYSMGKAAATQLLQMLHRTEGFPAVTTRFFLVYGPGQNAQRFLPQIIQGCLHNTAFPTSYGGQLRDFCYVADIVDGVFLALETSKAHGEIVNLASGRGIAIREMIETVCRLIGKGRPEFGALPYRSGENMRLYADIEKAGRLLGWKPVTSLEAGLEQTIHFYQHR